MHAFYVQRTALAGGSMTCVSVWVFPIFGEEAHGESIIDVSRRRGLRAPADALARTRCDGSGQALLFRARPRVDRSDGQL